MRLHRFFVKEKINSSQKVTLRFFDYDSILSQWKKVFKYLAGSRVILFDGSGMDYLCIIEQFDNNGAILRVLEESSSKEEENTSTEKRLTLIMSLIKNDNFDLVLQKATELGVLQIVPVITERTIKKDLNMSRSQRILVEASEQCGRKDVPVIVSPRKITEVLKELPKEKNVGVFVCYQNGEDIKEVLGKKTKINDLMFIIGPEGGWSPKEIKLLEDQKIKPIKISKNVLRAETAAIAVLSGIGIL